MKKKSEPTSPKTGRDPFFDNLKAILILLVVLGHWIEPWVQRDNSLKAVYIFLYTFHMPLFIFVAGVFSKKNSIGLARLRRVLVKYATLYFLFDLVYKVADSVLFSKPFMWEPLTPYWIMWFLLSLCCWNLMLFLFSKSKLLIPVAFAIGILAGALGGVGYFFSLSRTFYFFPFFLIGFFFPYDGAKALGAGWGKKVIALVTLALAIQIVFFLAPEMNVSWFYGSRGYAQFDLDGVLGAVWRGLTYALTLLISMAVMVWVPKKEKIFTVVGKYTLYIYLLHGLVIRLLVAAGYYKEVRPEAWWILLGVGGLAVTLSAFPYERSLGGKAAIRSD